MNGINPNPMATLPVVASITWINSDPTSKLKAYASIKIADVFAVNGIKVVEGKNGLFIGMPNDIYEKNGKTEYKDICFPTTAEMRDTITNAVIGAYGQRMAANQSVQQSGYPSQYPQYAPQAPAQPQYQAPAFEPPQSVGAPDPFPPAPMGMGGM